MPALPGWHSIPPADQPTRTPERGNDLLDDRVIADPDEIYDENEKRSARSSSYTVLSLDATNDRMLNKVAEMIDEASIQTKELEIVSKTHDDLFLRPAKPELGEWRVNAEKCICRWVGLRYGEDDPKAFVSRICCPRKTRNSSQRRAAALRPSV